MNLADIHRRAEENPGHCAVCSRKMPRPKNGGRPAIICGIRLRKTCRRVYETAYRAAKTEKSFMRKILSSRSNPKVGGSVLVALECGHEKPLLTGEAAGRKTTKCKDCQAAKVRAPAQKRVVLFVKRPRAKPLSG